MLKLKFQYFGHLMGCLVGLLTCEFYKTFKEGAKSKLCKLFSKMVVQFSCSVLSDSLWPHGLFVTPWTAAWTCPLPTPSACSNSCPLNQWCHLTVSFSAISFSYILQSFPASGSFQMSQFFTSEFEQTPGDSEEQGSLACYSPRGCKELDMTEWLKNNKASGWFYSCHILLNFFSKTYSFYLYSQRLFLLSIEF